MSGTMKRKNNHETVQGSASIKKCGMFLRRTMILFGFNAVMTMFGIMFRPAEGSCLYYVLHVVSYVCVICMVWWSLKAVKYARCRRCGRHIAITRNNIGHIASGSMPLCSQCQKATGEAFWRQDMGGNEHEL